MGVHDGRILTTSREICYAFVSRLRNIHRIYTDENHDFDEERKDRVIADPEAICKQSVPLEVAEISVLLEDGDSYPDSGTTMSGGRQGSQG